MSRSSAYKFVNSFSLSLPRDLDLRSYVVILCDRRWGAVVDLRLGSSLRFASWKKDGGGLFGGTLVIHVHIAVTETVSAVPEAVSTSTQKTQVFLDQFLGARSQLYCRSYVYVAAVQPPLVFNPS
jgi:hypothetical protein